MEYIDILDKITNLAFPVIAVAVSWGSISQKIKNLEERLREQKDAVANIKDNHLVHIQACFEKIRAELSDVRKDIYGIKKDIDNIRHK